MFARKLSSNLSIQHTGKKRLRGVSLLFKRTLSARLDLVNVYMRMMVVDTVANSSSLRFMRSPTRRRVSLFLSVGAVPGGFVALSINGGLE